MTSWFRGWMRILAWPAERMERRLLAVFLFLIVLPIGGLGYVSAERYTESIERNTVAYMSQVSDRMIGKLDDYMEDMKKISIIPSYVTQIQDGLKLSNRFYENRPAPDSASADNGGESVLSDEYRVLLQIRSQVENSIYFMNNIKEGTNTVYLFDR
ncbi:hypothetical protein [Cohnella caldifontis]|uniref:hypothetical protein n=1 Tax=Cohnella caldifontis TaxID=3027471 RepID=UPI0023ECF960|nr:hypothetical protein [Cohnella sp. YIM B05605]